MRIHRLLPFAASLLLAACESNPTAPTVNVDELMNQMSGPGITTYSSVALSWLAPAEVPSSYSFSSASCSYAAANQQFDCAPIVVNGFTFSRSYQLLDASGQPLSTPDPMAITAIRSITDVEGTATGPASDPKTLTIDRHEDMTMSGIRGAEHVISGTSRQQFTIAMSGLAFTVSETGSISSLRLPPSSAAAAWPLGGTIVADRLITEPNSDAITAHDVLTFDGTSIMTIAITSSGFTNTCKYNMATLAAPVCT